MELHLEEMITLYQDLNSSSIDVLTSKPSPLEFMRYVARNRPFVVRNALTSWPAYKKWTPRYLNQTLSNSSINVALTPHGNADSAVLNPADGKTYFVKPLEKEVLFSEFLKRVIAQDDSVDNRLESQDEIWYAQTQNDNLRGEYSALLEDVSPSIPWARIALQQDPDAVNLWIGSSKSVTALHRDNYENVYCQILGKKHFVLIPPTEAACVREKLLDQATYARDENGEWIIKKDDGTDRVPCAMWTLDSRDETGKVEGYERLCRPIEVSLERGDMLYLPALWYHHVSQSVGEEKICVAVNYWYDMDFSGGLYATSNYFRDAALGQYNKDDG